MSNAEKIADLLSGWPIGNGYYQSTIATDEAREIAAMLAPLIREAQAEAWDEGHLVGWEEHESPGPFVNDYWDSEAPNPYRSNDE